MSATETPETPEIHSSMWAILLVVIASLATCAIVNATEDAALSACYTAGFSPEECDR